MMNKTASIISIFSMLFIQSVFASSSAIPLADIEVSQDQQSIKRGVLVYHNTCRLCHSMKYIKYQHLEQIGFNESEIDKLRGNALKTAAMTRLMSDDASYELYGMVPPDLSIMAKARKHGPQYIYTLMTSYKEKDGVYSNTLFPGIKMPDVFDGSTYTDSATKVAIEVKVRDVTEFLTWSADPRAAERKNLGKYVIAYLIILSTMFYFVMKRVWRRLDE